MHSTISRWGNSLALRLPRHIVDQLRLVEGANVDLEVDGGILKVSPARRKYKPSDLLEGEPKRAGDAPPAEVDWGKPAGDEAW